MHLLVISHKKSSVHGHESFKLVPPSHLCASFVNKMCINLLRVLINIDEVTGIVPGGRRLFMRATTGMYVCMYVYIKLCTCQGNILQKNGTYCYVPNTSCFLCDQIKGDGQGMWYAWEMREIHIRGSWLGT
jgi:hypothetical protein